MYNKQIDKKWQDKWEEEKAFKASDDKTKKKFYSLVEFPYPSGIGLHIGHVIAYMGMEVISRKRRLEGYNVLFPIGFDAFGLPTENYAIKTGIHPRKVTDDNIKIFTKQLKTIGFSFDFDRQVDTTDPDYYKWTQWIFLKLFEKGLAYKSKTEVNYCTKCQVVLANEESQGGKCDRCDGEVIQMEKKVWMLKITDYADKLLEELDNLDFSPRIKTMQKNWIGKSNGAEMNFQIEGKDDVLAIYTTRPDTIFGVTFMVIAPEHPILEKYKLEITNYDEVLEYAKNAKKKTEFERVQLSKEKTGVEIKGINILNPVTGEKVALWIADYVMMGYGTGAIMAVPGHDTRDWEFAKKFKIPIKQVIEGSDISKEPFLDIESGKIINSDFLNGLEVKEAINKIVEYLEKNKLGTATTNFYMKDWAFARQRYWGEPVPIVKCDKCGLVALPEKELPLKLPEIIDFKPSEDGQSPLAKVDNWVNTTCPKCGGKAKRETDTMPQWAGSSWYYLRYTDPKNNKELASKENLEYWLPVDWYNGGMEHVTRHLIYSRFWHRFLYDIGIVPTKEPYAKRTAQGLILGSDGEKMSKSRGNVVNPDEIVNEYGADTLRGYILFIGEYESSAPWNANGVKGIKKFLDRVMKLGQFIKEKENNKEVDYELNKTIKKVTKDYEAMKFNTAIAQMMIFVNFIYKQEEISKKQLAKFIVILSPIAPHVAEELWQTYGNTASLKTANWPTYDDSLINQEMLELAVQINGQVKYKILVKAGASNDEIEKIALDDKNYNLAINGKKVVKIIVVPGRIVNIVAK